MFVMYVGFRMVVKEEGYHGMFLCVCDVVYHKNYFMCKEYLSSRNHKVDDIELKERMCMILMMLEL